MPALVVSRRGQRDLRRIQRYVARESGARRASELIDRILSVCALFAAQPAAGRPHPELHPEVRSCVCGLYLIFYRSRATTFEVVRVIHGRRDIPAAWNERQPTS